MKPLVSVVVPIFNVENFIKKCVNSIINQTYRNLEIILVDDGSPDNCPEICDEFQKNDKRIKVIHKTNGGLSDARNAGLRFANGDFVCFIDSDDYVEHNMIETIFSDVIERDFDVAIFCFYNEYVDTNEKIIKRTAVELDIKNPSAMLPIVGYAWNKLYKTSFLSNTIRFEKGLSLVEDIVFNEKVLCNTEKIEYINKPFYHYITRERSTLARKYHENSFQLVKLGFSSRRNIIFNLFGMNKITNETMASSFVDGIRYCCSNMFFFKNDLSIIEKYKNISDMLNDETTIQQVCSLKPKKISDRIIGFCLKFRITLLLFSIYWIKSILINRKKYID